MVPLISWVSQFLVMGCLWHAQVQSIVDWPWPATLTDLRSFLGLESFYMRSIQNFSEVNASLTNITKAKAFVWSDLATTAFVKLKQRLTYAHFLDSRLVSSF